MSKSRHMGKISSLCAWVIWSLVLVVALSSCNLRWYFSELSLEVQGGQDYFRFVEGTCIIALCLSSLSLCLFAAFRFWLSLQKLNSICFWTVTSIGENEEKVNTIQAPFLCFSHLQSHLEVWVAKRHTLGWLLAKPKLKLYLNWCFKNK